MTNVLNIPLELIDTAPQVRKTFKDASIAELAADIAAHGVLQPLIVQQNGQRFTLLIGERRLRALRYLGETKVPAIVGTVSEQQRKTIQLMENLHREDLCTKDLVAAIHDSWKELGTVESVAKQINKSASWVSKRLALALKIGPVTAELMDNVKDVELLYLFSKLEKLDGVKARMMVTAILAGDAGREDIKAAIAGEDDQDDVDQGDLFGNAAAPAPSMPAVEGEKKADAAFALKLALDALREIAELPAGSPAALKMKKTATAALARIDTV